MKPLLCSLVLLAAVCATACESPGRSLPTRPADPPAPPAAPAPSPISSSDWRLTIVLAEVTGDEACAVELRRRLITEPMLWPLTVKQSASELTLEVGESLDRFDYVGTIEGDAFTATGGSWPQKIPCGGGLFRDATYQTDVAGSFSAERRELTAKNTGIYRMPSGEVRVVWDWRAVPLQ